MATMEEIAKQLGITKGTVSKALSGAADVSETMRKSVLETAVELGYTRVSRTGEKKQLAVFVENMSYEKPEDFGWELITGFRKMAEPAGFSVDIIPLDVEKQRTMRYDEWMLSGGYIGAFILGVTLTDPWMEDFKTCRTPTVLYDNWIKSNPSITHVGIDNNEGMMLVVSRLKELGHSKIGYLSGALGAYIYQERHQAFLQATAQHALENSRNLIGISYFLTESLGQHLPRLLESGCTAIICSHDLLAHSVMVHCQELGLRIPQDLSIVGFDDIPLCRYATPPLSSVRQDRTNLGKSAFFALSSQINQIPISTLQLHAELIQRESMGPAPAEKPHTTVKPAR